jgi:type IV pilus assembly protein PilB
VVFGFFGKKEEQETQAQEVEIELVTFQGPMNGQDVNLKAHPRLVDAGLGPAKELISEALARRADALRIDPKGAEWSVALSIDGIAAPGRKLGKTQGLAITQVLKLLAALDVEQRTSPQKGAIKAAFNSETYRLDLKTIPTPQGERLIVRAGNLAHKLDTLAQLGMSDDLRGRLRTVCESPGLIVVCGLTGSGATSTLFGLVRNIDWYIYTIFTLRDLEGREIDLVSPQTREGDDLAAVIGRAIRMETNVILCDTLTEATAARQLLARAGDVTLLTDMHAKDTGSALLQLVAWSGNPQLVAEGLKGILTQRLVRLLCTDCRQAYKPKPDVLKQLGLPADLEVLYRKPPEGQGAVGTCPGCGGSGYFGRTAMFELLEVTEGMKKLILAQADAAAIREQMKKEKMTRLQGDGLRLVAEGKTSLEELKRVFQPAAEK